MARDDRPLWTCPRCGKSYVTRNAWHSCVVVPLDTHFEDRPRSRELFDGLVALLQREGPITISVSRTRIELMTRARFAGVQVRKRHLRLSLWLKERVESPRFVRVEHYGGRDWGHDLEIHDEADLDEELADWLRLARAVGDQQVG